MDRDEVIENRQEHIISGLLRAGVVMAAVVVLAGGVLYLMQHGAERPDYREFKGVPEKLRRVGGVAHDALTGDSAGIIQLGLLLLILTPIARVALSAVSFSVEKDRMYVLITLIVLVVLLFSLIGIK